MIAKVLATEFMKLHRAKETWATLAVLALMPLGIALFMWTWPILLHALWSSASAVSSGVYSQTWAGGP